jgi:hypothetical protein
MFGIHTLQCLVIFHLLGLEYCLHMKKVGVKAMNIGEGDIVVMKRRKGK